MVIGAVFAGGSGSRMGSTDTPKQYLMLGSKPILVHTVEKLYLHPALDHIVVLCPESWIRQTLDMLSKSLPADGRLAVIAGGATQRYPRQRHRLRRKQFGLAPDTVLLTHDAVRPFVTHRIISRKHRGGPEVRRLRCRRRRVRHHRRKRGQPFYQRDPERRMMYQGQTPQTFLALKLKTVFESLHHRQRPP